MGFSADVHDLSSRTCVQLHIVFIGSSISNEASFTRNLLARNACVKLKHPFLGPNY
jgi:hypothetical protein